MTFKAEILNVQNEVSFAELNNKKVTNRFFEFSRSKIFFNTPQKNEKLFLEPPSPVHSTSTFKDGIKYTFDKVYDDNDKKIFQITVGNHSYTSPIRISPYNRVKCNFIHKRYFIQKNKDELYKIIFAAIIGAIISAISTIRGYDKGYDRGYENGMRYGIKSTQDTTQLP